MGFSTTGNTNLEILKGQVPGHTLVHVHGHNAAVGTSFEDVWADSSVMIYLTSAETMNIASTSTNDSSAGTGARTITIEGLDANFNAISETITMNGTTDVVTTLSYIRVLHLGVLTVGSTLENQGDITATGTTTSTTPQDIMETNLNHSLSGRYTSPADTNSIFSAYEIDIGVGRDVVVDVRAGSGSGVLQTIHRNHIFQSVFVSNIVDVMIPPKTDIVFRAKSDASTAGVACSFNMIEVDTSEIP